MQWVRPLKENKSRVTVTINDGFSASVGNKHNSSGGKKKKEKREPTRNSTAIKSKFAV